MEIESLLSNSKQEEIFIPSFEQFFGQFKAKLKKIAEINRKKELSLLQLFSKEKFNEKESIPSNETFLRTGQLYFVITFTSS